MSLSNAVAAQFKLILRNKCMPGPQWTGVCLFHLSTAVLGYFLILVVTLAQIPILYNILKNKRDKNLIHPFSIGLMALMASNNVAYAVNRNLPISTWGEGVVLVAQHLIIINIFLIHQGHHRQAVAFTLFYVTVMVGSLTPVVPSKILMILKLLNMPMDIVRDMTIMYQCHKQGTLVSPVSSRRSIALLNICSLGRFLTACVHSQDVLLIVAYGQESVCTMALSTVVMVLRRRTTRMRMRKISAERFYEDTSSSGGEELSCSDEEWKMKRRRRKRKVSDDARRREEIEAEMSSSVEEILYYADVRRNKWRSRRNEEGSSTGELDTESSCSGSGSEERTTAVERERKKKS